MIVSSEMNFGQMFNSFSVKRLICHELRLPCTLTHHQKQRKFVRRGRKRKEMIWQRNALSDLGFFLNTKGLRTFSILGHGQSKDMVNMQKETDLAIQRILRRRVARWDLPTHGRGRYLADKAVVRGNLVFNL